MQFDENENDEYVQTYIEAERVAASEMYESQNSNFVAENFKMRNAEVNYISSYTPCIFADLTMSKIADLMSQEDVNRIGYWDEASGENCFVGSAFTDAELDILDANIEIIKADIAKSNYNVTGSGIEIGQFEACCPADDSVIKRANYDDTDVHATRVFMIMDTVAPNATYYATSFQSSSASDMKGGIEWLLSQGVNIINMSCGYFDYNNYEERSRWIDHIAYNHSVHVVVAAGNEGEKGVRAPAMAYNVITVGNTTMTSPYNRYQTSAYNNSPSYHNQTPYKPDLAAPGCYEVTYDCATSYSAPLVTGTIALMCQARTTLKTKPRVVKAILAASTGQHITSDAKFKELGAGLINANVALKIAADDYTYAYGTISSTAKTCSMEVHTGNSERRVALAYENTVNITNSTHENATMNSYYQIMDLKLEIIDPNENIVASCTDSAANLKIVKFTPTVTGTYTIRITPTAINTTFKTTYYGIAWK